MLSDYETRAVLQRARTIAIVGMSDKPDRASYAVARFLQRNGYRIIPVNPNLRGLVLGEAAAVQRLRRHPLARALRVDKLTLAALHATLLHYRRGDVTRIPIWAMIAATPDDLGARAQAWADALTARGLNAAVVAAQSTVGGGSLPGESLPTRTLALAVPSPDDMAARLRRGTPPVVARIEADRLLFDPRTVLPEQDDALLAAITAAR